MDKGISAIITIGFMWGVRPDKQPSMVVTAVLSLLMYEGLLYCIRYIRRIKRQKRTTKKTTTVFYSEEDARRLANEWIKHPLKEVI